MSLTKEEKEKTVGEFGQSAKDTGKTEVQIALLTKNIDKITGHLKTSVKDLHAKRGLLRLVGKRKRLLKYLSAKDITRYRNLLEKLDLRK